MCPGRAVHLVLLQVAANEQKSNAAIVHVGSCWDCTEETSGAWSAEPELQYHRLPGWLHVATGRER